MSTSPGASYTCTRNCVATGGVRVIREVTFGPSATVSQCLDECTATLGCAQVSYRTTVEMRDGVPIVRMTCTLLGAGDASSCRSIPTPTSPSRGYFVSVSIAACNRCASLGEETRESGRRR